MMLKNPGFTALAVITLALGIGANTAIFSVVNAAMLRPLPFPNAPRLVQVFHAYSKLHMDRVTVSPTSYVYIRDNSKALEQLAAFSGFKTPQNLTGAGDPQQLRVIGTTWNLFDILGVKPMTGRVFTASDDVPGGRVAILGYSLWRDRFGSDLNIVGRDITLDGANYTVVGIMPAGFEFPERSELWIPLGLTLQGRDAGVEYLFTVGTLRPGVTLPQLKDDMQRLTAEQVRIANDSNPAGWSATALPLQEATVGDMKTALWVLLSAVACVLLIACANIANLLLARAMARQKEIAIRSALGAGRWRLLRQFVTEGALLGLLGGVLGLLIGYAALRGLLSMVPMRIPSFIHINIDANVMLFTLALGIFTGLLFSTVPGIQITRGDTNSILKETGRSSRSAGRHFLRGTIVVLQLAAAVVLLISAGLMIKTFVRIQQASPGFDPRNVLTAQIALPQVKYKEPFQRSAFFSQLLERLRTLPGVESAAFASSLPLSTNWMQSFSIEGKQFDVKAHAHIGLISPDYMKTMRIPLLSGRTFTDADGETAPAVAIIDTNVAHAFFGTEDPIGKRLLGIGIDGKPNPRTVVGVVAAVKHSSPLEIETKGQVYVPLPQLPSPGGVIVLRTSGDPMALATALRKEVLAIDPGQPLQDVRPMEELLDEFVAQPRFNMMLLALFAGLALLLSAVGVYGVMAYSVTQRTHEIGVRMALGAQRADVLQMILKQALILACIGLAFGIAGALFATRALSSMLFGVKPADPSTFGGIALLLAMITVFAGLMPALRATRIEPVIALRD